MFFLPSNKIVVKFTCVPKISARFMSSSYPMSDHKPVMRAVKDGDSLQRGKIRCLTMFQMNIASCFKWFPTMAIYILNAILAIEKYCVLTFYLKY